MDRGSSSRRVSCAPQVDELSHDTGRRNAGGTWEDREVILDRNWVSSRRPKDLPAFNREMMVLFSEERTKAGKYAAV